MRYCVFIGFVSCLIAAEVQSQSNGVYDGVTAIKEIREGWLIVRLPGFENKITAIDSLLEHGKLSEKARQNLERELAQTLVTRDFLHAWYPVVFDSIYTFSKHAFIATHETAAFQSGEIAARTSDGNEIGGLHREQFFFATLDGYAGDPFQFTSRDHRAIGYPFPGSINKPRILAVFASKVPEWVKAFEHLSEDKFLVYLHVSRVNRKLHLFYRRKYGG